LSIFVDGVKTTINIDASKSLGDILGEISDATGLNAEINNGKISISSSDGKNVKIGTTGDTTNFSSVMSLTAQPDGSYESSRAVSKINTSAKILDEASGFTGIEAGEFKIGGATFKIDENTTLNSLLSQINASTTANASAYWDSAKGELILTSKTEGAFNINIESLSGNFTDVLGFTINDDGVKGLNQDAQTLGDYAKISINGTEIISSSNLVTSDISGIKGLTLELKGVSKPDKNDVVTPAKVNVEQNTDELTSAIKNFVDNFNKLLSQIDAETAKDAALYGESSLNLIRNTLRTSVMSAVEGMDGFKTLAALGISTGAVGSLVSANTDKLQFDEEKFKKALTENPEAVKTLLVGDRGNAGVMGKLETIVKNATDSSNGYFAARGKSFDTEIKLKTTAITTTQAKVDVYKTQLEAKFAAMESMIAKLKNQFNGFTGGL